MSFAFNIGDKVVINNSFPIKIWIGIEGIVSSSTPSLNLYKVDYSVPKYIHSQTYRFGWYHGKYLTAVVNSNPSKLGNKMSTFKVGDRVTVLYNPKTKQPMKSNGTVKYTDRKKKLGKKWDYGIWMDAGGFIFCNAGHLEQCSVAASPTAPAAPTRIKKIDTKDVVFPDVGIADALKIEECERCNNGELFVPFSRITDKLGVLDIVYPRYVRNCEHFILVPAVSAVKHVPKGEKRPESSCSRCRGGEKIPVKNIVDADQQALTKMGIESIIRVFPTKR